MKNIIKRIITVIIALALFVGIGVLLRYLMFDDVESYSRLMFHDLHNQEEGIDTIFVGSSHVRRSIIPQILDELLGVNTFNCGTADQKIDGSMEVIRDACRDNDIKHVYLDMYYFSLEEEFTERGGQTSIYLVSDYLPFSFYKVRYLLNAGEPRNYSNSFITARRNWEQLFDTAYISDLFIRKQDQGYLNYEFGDDWEDADGDYYTGKGYFAHDSSAAAYVKFNRYAFLAIRYIDCIYHADNDWHRSFQEIVDFCRNRGIELTLYTTPEPEWTFIGKGNYQEYHDAVVWLAQENGLEYYDFNLLKPEYFDDNDRELFMDIDHLNTAGAEKFSDLIGRFFSGQLEGEDLFYDNMEEKLEDEEPRVYGIAWPWNGVMEEYPMYMVANRTEGIEYRITRDSYLTGEHEVLQDYSENIYFNVPEEDSGILRISWRLKGDTQINVLEAEY